MLDVVVLTVNQDTFAGCVRTLDAQEVLYHGIVVANVPGIRVPGGWTGVPGSREQNYSESLNAAFRQLKGDRVLLVSDDARLWPDCIQSMLSHNAAMVGAVMVNADGMCNHVGMDFADGRWPVHLGRGDLPDEVGPCREVPAVTWAVVLLDREAIEHVGPLDTGYQWSHEDIDYELRIIEAGYGQPVLCTDAKATHDEQGVPDTPRDFRANCLRFAERWPKERMERVLS